MHTKLTKGMAKSRFSQDRPRFTDTLDVIKFLCKDMWTLVFRKQIDNLKTNHRVRAFPVRQKSRGIPQAYTVGLGGLRSHR